MNEQIRCKKCGKLIRTDKFIDNSYVCYLCGYYETLDYKKRLSMIMDDSTFQEFDINTEFYDPITFPGYREKYNSISIKDDMHEAIITGRGYIDGYKVMVGVMDTRYFMGSMGIVVGEKVARLFEYATRDNTPVIIFVASGGARIQEGIFSLMQMAKTAVAVENFSEKGGLFVSVLTNPCMGGVSASFAFLGDIILAEPEAMIGFAGRKVIEQTTKDILPANFQTTEYFYENGYIDIIVDRKDMKKTLSNLLKIHIIK
ncbi:acetyl-CoA carboxylase carboxyl transferase subunit beta [Blautia pseudococcoides]|nr:acetyl-CoA carboxylase carboxyl transferase subunit beta [Blautia pseudococcoides]